MVCPAELVGARIQAAPPAPAAGAEVTANVAGDQWIDGVIAWGALGWTILRDAQAECEAERAKAAK